MPQLYDSSGEPAAETFGLRLAFKSHNVQQACMSLLMGNLVVPDELAVDISATKDEHYWKISVRHPPDELGNKALITLSSEASSVNDWRRGDGTWRLASVDAVHRVE